MSGKQAKAKRKSAAKSAASERPRMDFVIENVRCFAGEHRVPIRPITLLVGENSTGKTTFMGCLHAAINLVFPSHKHLAGNGAGFNAPPFSMGGFREIARRVGGRPSKEFRLGFVPSRPSADDLSYLDFSFGDTDGEASTAKFRIAFANGEKLEIAKGPSGKCVVSGRGFLLRGNFPEGVNLSTATAMTIALFIVASDSKDGQKSERQKARRFLDKIGLSVSAFRPKEIISGMREGAKIMSEPQAMAFAPVRSKPKRTYSVLGDDAEDESGDVAAFMFRLSRNAPDTWRDLRKRLAEFGKESGMFSDFNVVPHGARSGGDFHLEVKLRGMKNNVADVGYGGQPNLPDAGSDYARGSAGVADGVPASRAGNPPASAGAGRAGVLFRQVGEQTRPRIRH